MTDKPEPIKATVNVVGVQRKTSSSGKPYLLVTTERDGDFSLWDQKLFDKITQRGNLACEWTQNGNFKNIVGVSSSQPTSQPTTGTTTYADRDYLITRQTALKASVDSLDRGTGLDGILERAQAFHDWILRDPSEPF